MAGINFRVITLFKNTTKQCNSSPSGIKGMLFMLTLANVDMRRPQIAC
jgi:hypothetical protein